MENFSVQVMSPINYAYKKGSVELKGLSPLMAVRPTFLDGNKTAGLRDYELTDHLSNVMAVISDRKLSVYTNSDTITDYYSPQVVSYTDYYSFGFPMAERSGNLAGYRFGFNGQEGDGEIYEAKTTYAFEYRMQDSRLGRFWSVDPLARNYPWNSTYAFAENRIVDGIELEGLEWQNTPIANKKRDNRVNQVVNHMLVGQANTFFFVAGCVQVLAGNIVSGGDIMKYPGWAIPRQLDLNRNLIKKESWLGGGAMGDIPLNDIKDISVNIFGLFFSIIPYSKVAVPFNYAENFMIGTAGSEVTSVIIESTKELSKMKKNYEKYEKKFVKQEYSYKLPKNKLNSNDNNNFMTDSYQKYKEAQEK